MPDVHEAESAGDDADHAPALPRSEVAHLAHLARLAVTDDELDTFAGQLQAVLTAVAQVRSVDTADVPPMTHAVAVTNVMRPDVVIASLPRETALAGAPEAEDGRFRVPRILDDEA
jgi:aspartyl-tRNA(Asn)/glutamyl-tRNA(Gln) amidotransferase subunit C